jgi:hypothetical protein
VLVDLKEKTMPFKRKIEEKTTKDAWGIFGSLYIYKLFLLIYAHCTIQLIK